jgi:hypothetical protein
MSIFIASTILLLIGSAYAILLKRKLAETFFLAMVTVIGLIYFAGLINIRGCLLYGVGSVCLFAIFCLAYCIYSTVKDKRTLLEIEFVEGLLLFGIFMVYAMYVGYNLHFGHGDEFSYWGIAVKHMYIFDAFTTSFSDIGPITLPAYFPGTSILHYFFTRFGTEFSEYPSYISLNIFYLSLLMPLIKNIFTKNHFIRCAFVAMIFALIPFQGMEFEPHAALTVDTLLAYLFGAAVIYYVINKYEESVYGVLITSCTVFMFTIVKDTGVLFALIICGIILLDTILFKRDKLKASLQGVSKLGKIKKILFYTLPLLSLVFPLLTWKELLQRTNITTQFSIPSASDILSLIKWNIDETQKGIVIKFVKAMFKPLNPLTYSVVGFTMVFIALAVVFIFFNKKYMNARRMSVITLAVIFGAVLYETALMLYYTFSFYQSGHGILYNLASYQRYTSSCIYGMQIFLLVFFIPDDSTKGFNLKILKDKIIFWKNKLSSNEAVTYNAIASAIPIILSAMLVIYLATATTLPFTKYVLLSRRTLSERYKPRSVSAIRRWIPYFSDKTTEPLYFISQSPDGWWRLRMAEIGDLYPYTSMVGWNMCTIGIDIEENLPSWPPPPTRFSPDEWEEFVLNSSITYLYMDLSDKGFVESYGHFFSQGVEDGMLYRVQNDDGHLLLIPVIEGH